MKLLIDMNLSPKWVFVLKEVGLEAAHFKMNRPRAIVDFARTHIGEVEKNFTRLKEIIGTEGKV